MASVEKVSVMDEVLEFLTSAPTLQQIIEFQASEPIQLRLRELLDRNRNGFLTAEENEELEEMSQINRLLRRLKIRAHQKLAGK